MSRVEYRALANIRHEYLLPIPCNITEMANMLERARNDRDAAGLTVGSDDDLIIVTEDTAIIGYWEQITDSAPVAAAEPNLEPMAQALASNAGHQWAQIPEEGHEQYRNQARAVYEEMNRTD